MKMLVFGEILYDVIGTEAFFGGAPANVCGHFAKLGEKPLMASRVGDDERGNSALAFLKNIGVDTSFITKDTAHPTGEVTVILSEDGIPDYDILKDKAYDYIQYTDVELQSLKGQQFDCFYFGTLNQRHPVAHKTLWQLLNSLEYGYTFYDINLRKDCFGKDILRESMQKADILKINDEELGVVDSLFDYGLNDEKKIINRLFELYPSRVIIVTKGSHGATVHTREESRDIPAVPAKVADTVGAGDAFCAAFIKYYARTKDPFLAARAGNLLGSYVAGKRGALPEYDSSLLKNLQDIIK